MRKILLIILAVLFAGTSWAQYGGGGSHDSVKNYLKRVNTDVIPSADNTYDLGSSSKGFKDLYITGTAYGVASDLTGLSDVNTATATAGNLLVADGTDWESVGVLSIDIDNDSVGIGTVAPSGKFSVGSAPGEHVYLFQDNADVGNTTDGQRLYVCRRGDDGDTCIIFYNDQYKDAQIMTTADSLNFAANEKMVMKDVLWANAGLLVDGSMIYKPSPTRNIEAATGITVTDTTMRVQSATAGNIDITANPQIVDGTDGQMVYIQGDDGTKTVQLDDGDGLALAGSTSLVLGQGDTIGLTFDSGDDLWYELHRSDN